MTKEETLALINYLLTNNELFLEFFKDVTFYKEVFSYLDYNLIIKIILKLNELKAKKYLEVHKIDTAIILAAGISSRFVPVCFETPKALLKVKGEVLIERQIKQLIEKGIKQIVIVVGYMKERFYYLRDKYGVVLVETDTYNVRNNHASVYAARKYLGNTIVTSADLYFNTNSKKNIYRYYINQEVKYEFKY